MKTRIWHLLLLTVLFAAIVVTTSCSDDKNPPDEPETEVPEPDPDPELPVITVTTTMEEAVAEGYVTDIDGTPLAGVNISSGTSQVVSNDKGLFSFDRIAKANKRFLFTFKKEGYFTLTRSGEFKTELSLRVVMQSKGNGDNVASTTFAATQASTLKAGGMEVAIPASALVTTDGNAYAGTVKAEMLYLSPDNENFTTLMPGGDMAAVRTDLSNSTLVSYGMTEVSLTDGDGNALQLKKGSKSEMKFPIPESMKSNPPATIPLWYFNEEAGLWVEEGLATLQGNIYVGTVSHFSWHNLDVPEERVTIKGKVTDCQGRPVSNTLVTVDQTSAVTNSTGLYTVYVPANTPVTATVKSEDYNSYSPQVSVPVAGRPGGTTVDNVNLELSCIPVISGTVVNSCSELVAAYVWIEYTLNGKTVTTRPLWISADGTFVLRIPQAAAGKVTIWVQTMAGDKMSRELPFAGEDIVVTGLEICEKFEEGTLTITVEGGQTIILPWMVKNSWGMILDTEMIIMCGSEMTGYIEEYLGEGQESTGSFNYISGSDVMYLFEPVTFVCKASGKGGYEVSIIGTGAQYNLTTGEAKESTIAGTVYVPTFAETSQAQNVSKWSDVGVNNSIPEMPLPIDNLVKMTFSKIDAVIAGLAYKEKTETDYNNVKATLAKAGYAIAAQEVADEAVKFVYYAKDDNYVVVTYSPDGSENIIGDGDSYKLIIELCQGYSKLGQFGGFTPGASTRNAPVFKALKLKR